MFGLIIISAALLLSLTESYEVRRPLVNTNYGQVRGSLEYSRGKREYKAFRGIPYAKPPIGDLRFKAPERPDNWTFPIDGSKDAPFCIQKNYLSSLNPSIEGQEDCLYLNVYVPQVNEPKQLTVMVFIHWGGFLAGRGSSDYLGADFFMDHDVILVTFNYRLGVLGFLSTLDDVAPGNYALKDQVLALTFVQENIGYFGGDKNRVTIFGQSAGSGSVSLHLVSPASRGLFHQAISQSGTALDLWAKPLNALQPNVTAAQALFVGCGDFVGNSSKLVACLRGVDAVALVNSSSNFKTFYTDPLTPFSLVTEVKTEANPNPFLIKEPLEYFRDGDFQKVPYIIGNVQDEGILRVAPLLRNSQIIKDLNANFDTLFPQLLLLSISVGLNTDSLYKNITQFYLNGKNYIDVNDPKSVQGLIDLYSDRAFLYGIYQNVILQSQKHHQPIWLYNFNYRGQYTYGDIFAATDDNIDFDWGVSHCDDLIYLFNSPALIPELKAQNDFCMSADLLTLWTNFAKFGDPDPQNTINWSSLKFSNDDEIKSENLQFLNISGKYDSDVFFSIEKGYYSKRMQFWASQSLAENFAGLS